MIFCKWQFLSCVTPYRWSCPIQGQIQTNEYVGPKSQDRQRGAHIRVSSVFRIELPTKDEALRTDEEEMLGLIG
jgi:hypothetical protein